MKKALFLTLPLLVALSFGCPRPKDDNTGNMNANQTLGGNTNGGGNILARDTKNKAVVIVVYEVNGEKKVAIAPEYIKLDLSKNHKIRFSAFNGLDEDIDRIEIDFNKGGNPPTAPVEDGRMLKIMGVDSGTMDDNAGNFRKAIGSGKYNYKVRVYGPHNQLLLPEVDPQVEMVGTRLD